MVQLSKKLIEKLIERIEVYGEDRIKVVWKFKTEYNVIKAKKSQIF